MTELNNYNSEFWQDPEIRTHCDQDWHRALLEITEMVGSSETVGIVNSLSNGTQEGDVLAFDYLSSQHPEAMPVLMERYRVLGAARRAKEAKIVSSLRYKIKSWLGRPLDL